MQIGNHLMRFIVLCVNQVQSELKSIDPLNRLLLYFLLPVNRASGYGSLHPFRRSSLGI